MSIRRSGSLLLQQATGAGQQLFNTNQQSVTSTPIGDDGAASAPPPSGACVRAVPARAGARARACCTRFLALPCLSKDQPQCRGLATPLIELLRFQLVFVCLQPTTISQRRPEGRFCIQHFDQACWLSTIRPAWPFVQAQAQALGSLSTAPPPHLSLPASFLLLSPLRALITLPPP